MIEVFHPQIDIDELMTRVRAEISQRHDESIDAKTMMHADPWGVKEINTANFQLFLSSIEAKCQVRTKLPRALDRFPINRSKLLQRIVLKACELVFREQRTINFQLVQVLRESMKLNSYLRDEVIMLHTKLLNIRMSHQSILKQVESLQTRYNDESDLKTDLFQQKQVLAQLMEIARTHFPQYINQEQLSTKTSDEKRGI